MYLFHALANVKDWPTPNPGSRNGQEKDSMSSLCRQPIVDSIGQFVTYIAGIPEVPDGMLLSFAFSKPFTLSPREKDLIFVNYTLYISHQIISKHRPSGPMLSIS